MLGHAPEFENFAATMSRHLLGGFGNRNHPTFNPSSINLTNRSSTYESLMKSESLVHPEDQRKVHPEDQRKVYPEEQRKVHPEEQRKAYPENINKRYEQMVNDEPMVYSGDYRNSKPTIVNMGDRDTDVENSRDPTMNDDLQTRIYDLCERAFGSNLTQIQKAAIIELLQCTLQFVHGLDRQYGTIPDHLQSRIHGVLANFARIMSSGDDTDHVWSKTTQPKRMSMIRPPEQSDSEFDDESDEEIRPPTQPNFTPVSAFTPANETPYLPQSLDREMDPVYNKRSSVVFNTRFPSRLGTAPRRSMIQTDVHGSNEHVSPQRLWEREVQWDTERQHDRPATSHKHHEYSKQFVFGRPASSMSFQNQTSSHQNQSSSGLQNPLHAHWGQKPRRSSHRYSHY